VHLYQLSSVGTVGTQQSTFSSASALGGTKASKREQHQMAELAILRVKEKLKGYEQNAQLSVTGHVNYLIQQAVDPVNLSKIFDGWQPFL